MTQTFMEAKTIDIPVEIIDGDECTEGHAWCEGECEEGGYHSSEFTSITAERHRTGNGWVSTDVTTSVYIDPQQTPVRPMIALIPDEGVDKDAIGEVRLTATQARKLAANLLNAADQADPMPLGVMATSPELLHVGDEVLTDDGWQRVIGLMVFADDEQVTVYTPERSPDESDGWRLDVENLTQIRRRKHGTCAIQFVSPEASR